MFRQDCMVLVVVIDCQREARQRGMCCQSQEVLGLHDAESWAQGMIYFIILFCFFLINLLGLSSLFLS